MEKLRSMMGDRATFNHYGPTETTVGVLVYEAGKNLHDCISSTVPIGRPLANTQAYLLDCNLQPVPIGVIGELHIGGEGLARGYLDRPEATAEKFIPNPFSAEPGARLYRTGDLGRYLADGNIEFFGRTDLQVKIRGFRIEPGEIETALRAHPAIREAVVIAREDGPGAPSTGKRLVAYVVARERPAPSLAELRSFLRQKLPEYMVPSAFMPMDAIPRTPHGKADLRALPPPDPAPAESKGVFAAPGNSIEEETAKIWAQVLGIERVGIHDNFFDLGGHSLIATRIVSRLRDAFDIELPLRSLFESPTISALAAAIQSAKNGGGATSGLNIFPRSRQSQPVKPVS
jgi:acyl carrier protein